ncbi:hypothetical protein NQ317_007083 [Molorchus minor]|uniref:Equilibrative nucleoside transporter 3 n=1 Tax=Molorchus minor TaxID=1323400 RepID=A0ABQ9K3Y9_9CUCU|nr:hypothetical protein NQ317_007083 [Molorchus minor]
MAVLGKNKKVSIVSIASVERQMLPHLSVKADDPNEPKDKYYFVHILFVLMGLMHFLPMSFFVTANGYWMYKFRNVSAEITDTSRRTVLQTHFTPLCAISNTVPSLIFIWISTLFGYKIKARPRILGALLILSLCFVSATVFVNVDTDSWQTLFFCVTCATMVVLNSANAMIEVAIIVILSKFPQSYMKVYLFGQGCAAIFNEILQIITLAIGTSTTASALLYFICGTTVMVMSLFLFHITKYNACYRYHASSIVEDTKKEMLPLSEARKIFKIVWPGILTMGLMQLTQSPMHHTITSLVVSQNYGSGSAWSDTYFVPVVTFLLADVVLLIGRMAASKINKTFGAVRMNVFMVIRMFVFMPLIYLCNAQPRKHLPVVFPYDWQFIIILMVFSFTNGYFYNMVFLDIAK